MVRHLAGAALQSVPLLASQTSASSRAACAASASRASRVVASRSTTVALGIPACLRPPLLAASGGGGHGGSHLRLLPASSSRRQASQAWDKPIQPRYSTDDIAMWRAEFGFARRQHSLASFGYTDDELLEWRRPFDALAEGNRICYTDFQKLVLSTYRGVLPADELEEKVQSFWEGFDADKKTCFDFGEFIGTGLLFNVGVAKESIRREGIKAAFEKYADESFMAEPHFLQLMCDHRFFAVTSTDVHKIMRLADEDHDGLVSFSDFEKWVETVDTLDAVPQRQRRRSRRSGAARGGARVAAPPPEPEG